MDLDYSFEEHDGAESSGGENAQGNNAWLKSEDGLMNVENVLRSVEGGESDFVDKDESSSSSSIEYDGRQSPLKRPAESASMHRPFKRQRSQLNFAYLELLNKEIVDAAQRRVFDDLPDLLSSQIGLTHWSSEEKHKFFEALARVGKNEISSIASAVGTKSIVETSQYMSLLDEARNERHGTATRPVLEPYEYPAAVEISQQCIHAQEEAADEIHLRQEARDEQREKDRWNDVWNVTAKVSRRLSREAREAAGDDEQPAPFARLFHTSRWLELSRRLFMNSSIPSSNWNFIDSEPPSVWAAAFEDFHSLAVSITKRLVQATLFMAMSRIRSKRDGGRRVRDMIVLQDAEAAISSLGMTSKLDERWIGSARRLRLDVYEDPLDDGEGGDDEEPPMSYDEVEKRLSGRQSSKGEEEKYAASDMARRQLSSDDESESSSESIESGRSPSPEEVDKEEAREIKQEAAEVFKHAAAGVRRDRVAQRALRSRIAAERQKERHANEWDEHASYKAELELWNMLQKKPTMELPRKPDPGLPKRSHYEVEGIYSAGRDWMQTLRYYGEWEMLPPPEEEEEGHDGEDDDNDGDEGGENLGEVKQEPT